VFNTRCARLLAASLPVSPSSCTQHLLATFRSVRVNSMSFELHEQQAALRVTLRCENGEP
jgi:hypothetical protein